MAEPSAFFPSVIDLSATPIQLIRTSDRDPRVTLDKTGVKATDANGTILFELDATNGVVTAQGLDITTGQLSGQIQTGQIADGAVQTGKIADGAVTTTQISAAAGIRGTQIANGTIQTENIAANAITTGLLAAGAVTTNTLAAGAVTATILAAGAVTAATIAAGAIDGKVITGALFQNSNADPRTAFDASGFWVTDASGRKLITIDNLGGLELTEATGGALSILSGITWHDSGGTVREWIQGSFAGTQHILTITSTPVGTNIAEMQLYATVGGGGGSSGITLNTQDTVGTSFLNLLDSRGRSDLLQIAGSAPLRTQTVWGFITAGTPPVLNGGNSGNLTVSRVSTGVYKITFSDQPFANTGYLVLVSVVGGYSEIVAGQKTVNSVEITCLTTGDVASDLNFHVLCIGVW